MASEEENGAAELAVVKSEQDQELVYHDEATQEHEQLGNYEAIASARGSGGLSSNEKKWKKNGFGQGKHKGIIVSAIVACHR